MSYYYNYYLGTYDTVNDTYDILGPFDKKGNLMCILWRSRSYASDLHDDMTPVPKGNMSEEMKKAFSYTDYAGKKDVRDVKYIPVSSLSAESPYKGGYVLREDVMSYLAGQEEVEFEEIAQVILSAEQFATLASNSRYKYKAEKFIKETGELEPVEYTSDDFIYYRWISSNSRKSEEWQIKNIICILYDCFSEKGKEIVLLETEG